MAETKDELLISPCPPRAIETWRKRYLGKTGYLLSPTSVKIEKSNLAQARYYNVVMYLAPATMLPGFPTVCPSATPGCFGKNGENCIAGSGQLRLPVSRSVMLSRTKFFHEEPELFLERLIAEIEHFDRRTKEEDRELALRLNGTSDIAWERISGYSELFGMFPDVQFYDYTKVLNRAVRDGKPVHLQKNYHLTFSQSELNHADVEQVVKLTKINVAKVFPSLPGRGDVTKPEPLPASFMGRRVIDGDLSDLRFSDPKSVIVGLRAKGDEMRAAVKSLRVLTGSVSPTEDVRGVIPEDVLTPAQQFLVGMGGDPNDADRVKDGRLDAASQVKWLEEFAGLAFDHPLPSRRKYARFGQPFTMEIGADTWSAAAPVFGALFVRRDLGFRPVPKSMAGALTRLLESFFSSDRALIGTLKVSELARFVGGARKLTKKDMIDTWDNYINTHPIVVGDELYKGSLIGAALRGAVQSEPVTLFQTKATDRKEGGSGALLGVLGSGWLYLQYPFAGQTDEEKQRAAHLKPYMFAGKQTVHRTPPPGEAP